MSAGSVVKVAALDTSGCYGYQVGQIEAQLTGSEGEKDRCAFHLVGDESSSDFGVVEKA